MREIKIGYIYRHFKGKEYKVIDIVNDCDSVGDDIKKVVIYEAMYGNNERWARKYDDFVSLVDHEKYPEISQIYRFEEISTNI